ncbi:hypothetical protein DPMN_090239 [Dreissena polymorpha]|uniref:Uncharacterized protein n=1 Tax=Dreissena polymorpha TaxID=45954 RepID=A0A9D4QY56_DREPO|nr:hypothetical protein DPMN_090239 [Dreissena polymorpha]
MTWRPPDDRKNTLSADRSLFVTDWTADGSNFAHLRGTNILFHDPRQNCPAPSSHVIQLTPEPFFNSKSRIKETNVLSKFHENWAKNVTSTVLTCFHYIHIEKNAPPTGGHVFSPISTIFELVGDIN